MDSMERSTEAMEQDQESCPECGGSVAHLSGCAICVACGFSKCTD